MLDWWSMESAVHRWMAQARALAPSLQAPITLEVPTLSLVNSTVLRPGGGAFLGPGQRSDLQFAIWREDCAGSPEAAAVAQSPPEGAEEGEEVCIHLAVANVNIHSGLLFTLELGGVWPALLARHHHHRRGRGGADSTDADVGQLGTNATRIFDNQYQVLITAAGQLSDFVDTGTTNIYEIGCHRLRPNASTGWLPCTSRRGQCMQGWSNEPSSFCGDD